MREKIGKLSDIALMDLDKALCVTFDIKQITSSLEVQQLNNYISELTKPLVITEGKTD